jgi:DNA-binding LytR/AlgR family response regulator
MKLKCIIVDDEPLASELLKSYALQTPSLELVGTYNSAIDALPIVNDQHIDLIFLDINMPKMNGLEFSKVLPVSIKIIFTTAYDQYAIDGFKANALDYLLKPINYSDFLQASNRAMEWYTRINKPLADSIFVKSGYRIEKIEYGDILYIENQKDYVKFHLDNLPEPISSLMSIQQLSEKLPGIYL